MSKMRKRKARLCCKGRKPGNQKVGGKVRKSEYRQKTDISGNYLFFTYI